MAGAFGTPVSWFSPVEHHEGTLLSFPPELLVSISVVKFETYGNSEFFSSFFYVQYENKIPRFSF